MAEERVFEGIDGALRAQSLDDDGVDATILDALHRAYAINDEVLNGSGPLLDFIKEKQRAMIEVLKALPSLRPTDVDSIVKVQQAIEQYLDPVRFLTEALQTVQSAEDLSDSDADSGSIVEDDLGED